MGGLSLMGSGPALCLLPLASWAVSIVEVEIQKCCSFWLLIGFGEREGEVWRFVAFDCLKFGADCSMA